MGRPRLIRRIRRDGAYLLIRAAVGLFRAAPRRAALAIASCLGRLAPSIFRGELRRAREHLTFAFSGEKTPEEIDRIARETFRFAALNFADTVRIGGMSPDDIRAIIVPHHLERLIEALSAGNGVIGLTSHTGCWEMLGSFLAASGVPIAVIAQRLYDPRLEELLYRTRTGAGMRVISRGKDTRDVIRVLREGQLLGVLIDQDIDLKGAFVDFFGRPAHTATAPAYLSLKYSAPVLPIFTWRDSGHFHHAWIGEPVEIEKTGDMDRDAVELTARCSNAIEAFIREHPEQWVWFHRRWKTRPE